MRNQNVATASSRAERWFKGLSAVIAIGSLAVSARAGEPSKEQWTRGRELFLREWVVNDPRSHGGDGLGPVFNDSSCVACHNAGAPGGGGPNSKNVDIITAVPNVIQQPAFSMATPPREPRFLDLALESLLGIEPPRPTNPPQAPQPPPAPRRPDTTELIKAHAGFRTARSVVLHRFASEPGYEAWRNEMLGTSRFGFGGMVNGFTAAQRADAELNQIRMMAQFERNMGQTQSQIGPFTILHSQRNPTALFGAGLIDSIPDSVLEQAAQARYPDFPEISGRVSRQKDGRIGRFGWKAQTPTLEDFVLTACAVELGLEVPGHSQGGLPRKPEVKARGLDLNAEECNALTAYVKALPAPSRVNADNPDVVAGKELFGRIGCATCHSTKLGDVEGLYSDLLVHDMGPELGDTGQYGVFVPDSDDSEILDEPQEPIAAGEGRPAPVAVIIDGATPPIVVAATEPPAPVQTAVTVSDVRVFSTTDPFGIAVVGQPSVSTRPKTGPASRQEWRTPPLWGLRDSGPYLHDGRAATLERAIALHGGEGSRPARNYFTLSPQERMQLQAFLKSLTAPPQGDGALTMRED